MSLYSRKWRDPARGQGDMPTSPKSVTDYTFMTGRTQTLASRGLRAATHNLKKNNSRNNKSD